MMRKTFQLLACAAVLAAPLAFTVPAAAEPDDEMSAVAAPQDGKGDHHKFHEQWEQFRGEHDALIAERDRLMERCMDAKGQEKSACDEKWADLRARHQEWRERMMAFHEQGGSAHALKKGKHGHKGMKQGAAAPAPAAAPAADGKHHHHHGMKQQAAPAPAAQ